MPTEIPTSTVLYITNHSPTKTFSGQWENNVWRIPPGEEVVAPYFAVCSWFGDPRATNIGDPDACQETQYRTNEQRRLSVMYGTYDHQWSSPEPFTAMDNTDSRESTNVAYIQREDGTYWHPNLPYVTVRDIAQAPVHTIFDDPQGDLLHAANPTTVNEARVTEGAILELQRQVAQMQSSLAITNQKLVPNPAFEGEDGARTDIAVLAPDAPASADDGSAPLPPPPPARPVRPTRPVKA